jgi:hypothetical protein
VNSACGGRLTLLALLACQPVQAYLIAYLVLNTINNGTLAPLNPGTLYRLQNPEWFRHLWPAGHCCDAGGGGGQSNSYFLPQTTDTPIQLGEAVALSHLRDHARTCNERFRISLTKVDGTTATRTSL